jgi:hypothetical protein
MTPPQPARRVTTSPPALRPSLPGPTGLAHSQGGEGKAPSRASAPARADVRGGGPPDDRAPRMNAGQIRLAMEMIASELNAIWPEVEVVVRDENRPFRPGGSRLRATASRDEREALRRRRQLARTADYRADFDAVKQSPNDPSLRVDA